jgi:hypothetical protein
MMVGVCVCEQVSPPSRPAQPRGGTVNLSLLRWLRPFLLFCVCACVLYVLTRERGMLIIRELFVWEREKTSKERHECPVFPPECPAQQYPALSSELEVPRLRKREKGIRNRKNRIIVIVTMMICPEAPNVPETAMERRYPLCPMQKRKAQAHVSGISCQTRPLGSLLYRTCRPLLPRAGSTC